MKRSLDSEPPADSHDMLSFDSHHAPAWYRCLEVGWCLRSSLANMGLDKDTMHYSFKADHHSSRHLVQYMGLTFDAIVTYVITTVANFA